LLIITELEVTMRKLRPVTPGELLKEEFLVPMGVSQYRLAKEVGVPAQRISEIVAGKRSVTADTDLRLCRFFGLSKGYWLRAQVAHDIELAERDLAPELRRIMPWQHEGSGKNRSAPRAASAKSPTRRTPRRSGKATKAGLT